jgi:alpha-1,2-mannosyltransferase
MPVPSSPPDSGSASTPRPFLSGWRPAALVLAAAALPNLAFMLVALFRVATARTALADSWEPMRQAYQWFASHPGETIYQTVFFKLHVRFQYPPSSLLIFAAANSLHCNVSNRFLDLISWFFVWTEAAAVARIAWVLSLSADATLPAWVHSKRILFLIACLTIAFYPVAWGFSLGQVQTWLNAWFVLACLCWVSNRRLAAGLFIGAICLFKPQFILFFVWAALRKQGRFLVGCAAILVPGELLALLIFGYPNHLDYLNELRFLGHHGQFFYLNQSVNGLLNRFIGNTDSIGGFPPYNKVVDLGTTLTSTAMLGAALVYRMRAKSVNVVDFLIAGLTFTLASPIAWTHHYGFLPAAFVVLLALVGTLSPAREKSLACLVLAVSYSLCAYPSHPNFFPATGLGSLLLSPFFFGALGALGLLYFYRDRSPLGRTCPD